MFDAKQYAEMLAQEAGASDAEKQALLKVLTHEKVSKRLQDETMRHDDYSRAMDKLRESETAFNATKKSHEDWYTKALATTDQNARAVEEATRVVDAYRKTYGELDGAGKVTVATPTDVVTKDDLKKALDQWGSQAISITKDAMRISVDHFKRFGEVIDPDALEKFAVEKGLPLRAAYEAYVAPRVAEKSTQEWEAKVKAAREEGAKEALSKAHLPVDAKPKEFHPFFDREGAKSQAPADERGRVANFVDSWNSATAAGASK